MVALCAGESGKGVVDEDGEALLEVGNGDAVAGLEDVGDAVLTSVTAFSLVILNNSLDGKPVSFRSSPSEQKSQNVEVVTFIRSLMLMFHEKPFVSGIASVLSGMILISLKKARNAVRRSRTVNGNYGRVWTKVSASFDVRLA